ncbi:CBS domain-containing protein [Desulfurococcaceae archaeon MEX13E-LK6-19]|nr:CBS domain-containing protein [Desulfurococcaceae archaeon MEX13E-LK6-19]
MLTARYIMTPEIRYINVKDSIAKAARRILGEGVGSLIVVDENVSPIGIVTKRDIIRAILFEKFNSDEPVEKIMSKPLITIDADAQIEEIINTMIKYNISHLPVKENGKIIGMISDQDLMEYLKDLLDIIKKKLGEQ